MASDIICFSGIPRDFRVMYQIQRFLLVYANENMQMNRNRKTSGHFLFIPNNVSCCCTASLPFFHLSTIKAHRNVAINARPRHARETSFLRSDGQTRSGCRSPDIGVDTKHTYSSEVDEAKMDWPYHKNA